MRTALLRPTRLSDPAYLALAESINTELSLMDEASVNALQHIEPKLLDLRRRRDQMAKEACRDEQGRCVFMTRDETGARYEDGRALIGNLTPANPRPQPPRRPHDTVSLSPAIAGNQDVDQAHGVVVLYTYFAPEPGISPTRVFTSRSCILISRLLWRAHVKFGSVANG